MMERTENRCCPDELGLGPAQQIEPRRVGQNSSAQVGQNSWTQPEQTVFPAQPFTFFCALAIVLQLAAMIILMCPKIQGKSKVERMTAPAGVGVFFIAQPQRPVRVSQHPGAN